MRSDMRRILRPYLGLLLALMLALTGQSMAMARGASSPVGEMELCTGTGPITILVDENGQPTGPAHICPDCALSLFAAIATDDTQPLRPLGRVVVLTLPAGQEPRAQPRVAAQARGPPLRA